MIETHTLYLAIIYVAHPEMLHIRYATQILIMVEVWVRVLYTKKWGIFSRNGAIQHFWRAVRGCKQQK